MAKSVNNLQKVIITSDLLRVGSDPQRLSFIKNTKFLYSLLNKQLSFATSCPVKIVDSGEGYDFDIELVYQELGLEASTESWIKTFDYKGELPSKLLEYFNAHFESSFVVGYELSPLIVRIFSELDIPCISLAWNPIRFMDDIFFGFLSNSEEVFDALLKYRLSESLIYISAELLKARAVRSPQLNLGSDSLLIGQTEIDRSLISEGKIKNINEYTSEIKEFSKGGNILFKPHPFAEDKQVFEGISEVKELEFYHNIYDVLAGDEISRILSLSSSALHEAKYFGKETKRLIPEIQKFQFGDFSYNDSVYVPVMHEFLSVEFWSKVLAPYFPAHSSGESPLSFIPNRLRKIARVSWGYVEPELEQIIEKY